MKNMKDLVLFGCVDCGKVLVLSFDANNTVDILKEMSQLQEHVEHLSYSITLNTEKAEDVAKLLDLVGKRAMSAIRELGNRSVVVDAEPVGTDPH
jgi:sorbitol-specific phosphotransferase system component IIA